MANVHANRPETRLPTAHGLHGLPLGQQPLGPVGSLDKWPAQVAFLVLLRGRVRILSDNGGHHRPILLSADG